LEVIVKIFVFLFGLVWGSFLNVVIYRVPEGISLLKPRSFCPVCGHKIKWYDNIPLFSYLVLRGKCRYCGAKIPLRYPLVELWTGLTFLLLWTNFHPQPLEMFRGFVFTSLLIILAGIDASKMLLPDIFTIPGTLSGIIFSLFLPPGLKSSLLGAAVGYASLWIFYKGFLLITGKEGMGFGDFKMFAMVGAFMGIQHLLPVLLLASVAGVFVGIGIMVIKRKKDLVLPFGTFLALASWAIYVFKLDLIRLSLKFTL